MAVAANGSLSASERPRSVIVFVSAFGAFMLAAFATFYPQWAFPWALIALPVLLLIYGVLALGVWNGSKVAWVINVWIWGGVLVRTITWFVSGEQDASGSGAGFNENLLNFVMAAVLLNLLFTPSLFRWVWKSARTGDS